MSAPDRTTTRNITIAVRLTPNQITMLLNLIAQRINQMSSLALVKDYSAELRRQWSEISKNLQEPLDIAAKGWKDR